MQKEFYHLVEIIISAPPSLALSSLFILVPLTFSTETLMMDLRTESYVLPGGFRL